MTGGSHLSAFAGAGERRWVGGDTMGRLGQAPVLGCDREKPKRAAARADQAEEKEGRRQTFAGWARSRTGLKGREG
jgi:hypothetical protein